MVNEDKLVNKELETAIWYLRHRVLLRRLVIVLIVAIDLVLVLYSGFGVGKDIFSFGNRKQQEFELLHSEIQSNLTRSASRPQDLQFGGIDLLRAGGVTDVLARVQNPNPEWYARFSYTIGLGGAIERADDGFLLPGEERPFYRAFRNAEGGVAFNIENVSWRRVNVHDIPDFGAWRDERLNFEVAKARFVPAITESASGARGSIGRAQFTITNKSAYDYFEPRFLVLLYRGSRLVGIQSTLIANFQSGEVRDVELSWFDSVGAVSSIEVVPEIDIMDEGVYLKPGV